ncbi:MAG: 4Fe-4S dicluster domain-containing protein, partial [Nitrospiraceae bacterium]|nr:4Fe-4S dicluster domain-containing protein [Nitrospiraceae bacterium]
MKLNRRDFLKLTLAAGATCAAGGAASLIGNNANASTVIKEEFEPLPNIKVGGIIRPPGALPEKEFRSKCISCGVCVNVCHTMKYDTLSIAGLNDLRNFGLPYVKDTRDFPCALCMECPKSCPTGALKPVEKQNV